jgi:hypothetical protein
VLAALSQPALLATRAGAAAGQGAVRSKSRRPSAAGGASTSAGPAVWTCGEYSVDGVVEGRNVVSIHSSRQIDTGIGIDPSYTITL